MVDVEDSEVILTKNEEYQARFILVDDDHVTNAISEMVIKIALGEVPVRTFTNGHEALKLIRSYVPKNDGGQTIILLDLNMPIVSGWEFLEYFDNLSDDIKHRFRLYILSSSISERDKERSYTNKNVIRFLTKPLTREIASEIDNEASR